MEKIDRKTYTFDAKGKILGRLVSKIIPILTGKAKANYAPNIDKGDYIVIKNIKQLKFTGRKLKEKKYYHYSGYPGGLKIKKMGEVFKNNPGKVFKKAVYRMLPKNKLRKERMKRIKIEN